MRARFSFSSMLDSIVEVFVEGSWKNVYRGVEETSYNMQVTATEWPFDCPHRRGIYLDRCGEEIADGDLLQAARRETRRNSRGLLHQSGLWGDRPTDSEARRGSPAVGEEGSMSDTIPLV